MTAPHNSPCATCAECSARLDSIESGIARIEPLIVRIAHFTTTLETIISGLMKAKGRAGNIIRDALTTE